MTPEAATAYGALSEKRMALTAYLQALIAGDDGSHSDEIAAENGRTNLELNLTSATISDLLNDAPVVLPTDAVITAMRQTAANLQQAINASASFDALVTAADALIKAWPSI